jgi:hypothetical protein
MLSIWLQFDPVDSALVFMFRSSKQHLQTFNSTEIGESKAGVAEIDLLSRSLPVGTQ